MPMTAKERYQKWRAKATPAQLEARRVQMADINRRYRGWSHEAVERAWLAQRGCCGICTRDMLRNGKSLESMCADHLHDPIRPRMLLCGACNRALGFYEKHQRTYIRIDVYENYLLRFEET